MTSKKKIGIALCIIWGASFLFFSALLFVQTTKTRLSIQTAAETDNSGGIVIGSTEGEVGKVTLSLDSIQSLLPNKPDLLDNQELKVIDYDFAQAEKYFLITFLNGLVLIGLIVFLLRQIK
jgi:hypothetical protein